MDKITNKKNNILRICAGNDFSIVVQITEYDTEASAWVNYDLSAVSDVHMSLIAENGKHIKLPVTVNSNGTVSAAIQSAYLQKTTYGIEITWLTDSLNRRTYSPCLLQIVTSTAESSSNIAEYESNDAYHFNIKMMSDVAILSIGKISDEYITESELADELLNYATNSSVETQISTLWNDANDTFVDNDELANAGYVTGASLSEMGYVTGTSLSQMGYITAYDIPEYDLSSYATSLRGTGWNLNIQSPQYSFSYELSLRNSTDNELSKVFVPAHNGTKNSQDEWTTPFWSGLLSRVDYSQFKADTDRIDAIVASYVTSSYLNSTLSGYVNGAEYDSTNHLIVLTHENAPVAFIDAAPFIIDGMVDTVTIDNSYLVISFNTDAGKQDISIPISDIFDAEEYYTKEQVDYILLTYYVTATELAAELANQSYVTQTQLDNAAYITINDVPQVDLSSYVTYNYLSNQSYATTTYVETSYNSLDSRVTYIEQHGGGGGTVPDNVVTSYDGTYIYCLSQSDYDTLEQGQQLDDDTFYYITDADNNYVSKSYISSYYVASDDIRNIVQISQSDYSNLATPDPNTLYIVV